MPTTTSNTKPEPCAGRGVALLLTAPGVGALATIRLHGPGTADLLARHFSRPLLDDAVTYGTFQVDGKVVDDIVLHWDRAQTQADLHVHGGHWVIHQILQAARDAGLRVVDHPGLPLPPEATDGGSPLAVEIQQWLPLARTREAIASLLNQEGTWTALLRQAEAGQPVDLQPLRTDRSLHWLLQPPRIAIVGIPNAGKSTLANALFARDRTITADLPGTTRDWIEDDANLDGLPVRLIDTPGLRSADCFIESQAIANARPIIARADLVLLILDATRPADRLQQDLQAAYPQSMTVYNKADLAALDASSPITAISALTGQGIDSLRLQIRQRFGCQSLPLQNACAWTPRQQQILASDRPPLQKLREVCGHLPGVPIFPGTDVVIAP